jgi:hypothetical protein
LLSSVFILKTLMGSKNFSDYYEFWVTQVCNQHRPWLPWATKCCRLAQYCLVFDCVAYPWSRKLVYLMPVYLYINLPLIPVTLLCLASCTSHIASKLDPVL